MPTYEYRCKSCEHRFDIVQSFSDDALTECPSCGEPTLKKVFGNVGITFKGSGFYKTDSRSAGTFGSTKDADKSDGGSAASGSSGSSVGDTSSATKSEGSSAKSESTKAPATSSSSSSND